MARKRPFQLLIKPVSGDCNLRCDYCFYLRAVELYPEEKRHIMPEPVLERMVKGLLEYRFPQTVFAWQGGEPTLTGIDFFRKAVEFQQQYGAPGQLVGNAIQTNGILIDEDWCRLMRDYRFLVGLSMDGPPEIHDHYRKYRSGKGTWEKTMAAARLMEKYEVSFNILCVVNDENVKMGVDLVKWFVDQGFNYLQFIPCVEKNMPQSVDPDAFGDFLCEVFDYWSGPGFGNVSIRDFDAMLTTRVNGTPAMCIYGDRCDHYVVVEHNGDVYPCDFFVYEDWRLGNLMDAPLHSFFETEKYKKFAYQKDKVPACRGCKWRALCHGGCQKDRLYSGGYHDKTPLCSAYMKFFEHADKKLTKLAKHVKKQMAQQPQQQPSPM